MPYLAWRGKGGDPAQVHPVRVQAQRPAAGLLIVPLWGRLGGGLAPAGAAPVPLASGRIALVEPHSMHTGRRLEVHGVASALGRDPWGARYPKARSRSAITSDGSSMPAERRISPLPTPRTRSTSSGSPTWLVAKGYQTVMVTSARLGAKAISCRRARKWRAAASPPRRSNDSMPLQPSG